MTGQNQNNELEDRALKLRHEMVENQIRRRGIHNEEVLNAMMRVKRHLFMPSHSLEAAYGDHAMPIGHGQTISQPYMVATMTDELIKNTEKRGRVLEIGTGSGYQAAILSHLFEEVITIERIEPLASHTREMLKKMGYENIKVIVGDGTVGYKKMIPYDGIIVTAGAPHVPESLKQQLSDGGALVIPVGSRFMQDLKIIRRKGNCYTESSGGGCIFVPLIGKEGWSE